MLVGYSRTSTDAQHLDLQVAALEKAGAEKLFSDQMSGAKMDRPGLQEALSHLRANDTLMVWKLDRLGRGMKGLVDLVGQLEAQGVHFRSLTDAIDTSTPAGRFFFHVMASLAQMERELTHERTMAGLAAARARGRVGGRKRLLTPAKMEAATALLEKGMAPRMVAESMGVSIATLYRWAPGSDRKT